MLCAFAPIKDCAGDAIRIVRTLRAIALVYWIQVDPFWAFAVMIGSSGGMDCDCDRVFEVSYPLYVSVVVLSSLRFARFSDSPLIRRFGCVGRTLSLAVLYLHQADEDVPETSSTVFLLFTIPFQPQLFFRTRTQCR